MTKRTVSVIVSTVFFAIFGTLAIIVGIVDIMNPPHPYAYKLPILGHLALLVGILSLTAMGLLWRMKKLGGYIGTISFAIAYVVNVYVGENTLAHAIAGAIVGIILLTPLALSWKTID
ncbi:hypothetical protein KEJ37_05710 [Candidatus Bathyarchaeota archaeon]|nr:hypothetical protein [Candidatus Bathyarchaeota archaeon]